MAQTMSSLRDVGIMISQPLSPVVKADELLAYMVKTQLKTLYCPSNVFILTHIFHLHHSLFVLGLASWSNFLSQDQEQEIFG